MPGSQFAITATSPLILLPSIPINAFVLIRNVNVVADETYHRKKIAEDPEYRQVCADSREKWRENNPGYQKHYLSQHEDYCEQNRQKQQERNRKRQLSLIVKNNLAIDVKRLPAKVWMTGPGLDEIVKNNLAISQVFILQTVRGSEMRV